jgi:hypothetical protein
MLLLEASDVDQELSKDNRKTLAAVTVTTEKEMYSQE